MNLSRLFILHALVTFVAGIVLIVSPEAIPATVNIEMLPDQYLLCYLLASSELAIAFLSFSSRSLTDLQALKLISLSFIIFHLSTALLEGYMLLQGGSLRIVPNIVLRIIISVLFFYYGRYKLSGKEHS